MKRFFHSISTGLRYAANTFGAGIRMRNNKRSYGELIKEEKENLKWFWLTFGITLAIAIIVTLIKTNII